VNNACARCDGDVVPTTDCQRLARLPNRVLTLSSPFGYGYPLERNKLAAWPGHLEIQLEGAKRRVLTASRMDVLVAKASSAA
jgi:hypothetical protein